MDEFMVILFDNNFEEVGENGSFVGKFVGKRADSVIRAADDVANHIPGSITRFTNIPQEAMQEYNLLNRVSRRHKPLRDLRRV